jgi:hypothetical protein
MAKRARITVDWLRKGRAIEDLKLATYMMQDGTEKEVLNEIARALVGKTARKGKARRKLKDKDVENLDRLSAEELIRSIEPSDSILVRTLAWLENRMLDRTLFEQAYGLAPLELGPLPEKTIDGALNYGSVHKHVAGRDTPLKPIGDTLHEQIDSLLPQSLAGSLREPLLYVLSRIVSGQLPKEGKWPLKQRGLDPISTALMTIHLVSRTVGQPLSWLVAIWTAETERHRISRLHGILTRLSQEYSVKELREDLDEASKEIALDVPLDPALEKIAEQQDIFREYKPSQRLKASWLISRILPLVKVTTQITQIDRHLERLRSRGRDSEAFREKRDKLRENRVSLVKEREALENRTRQYSQTLEDVRKLKKELRRQIGLKQDDDTVTPPAQFLMREKWGDAVIGTERVSGFPRQDVLTKLQSELNILRYEPLVRVCKSLAKSESPGRLTAPSMTKILGVKGRSAYLYADRMSQLVSEIYMPSLAHMGLKSRYIFTKLSKSAIDSRGVSDRLALSHNEDFQVATVHVEPTESSGPPPEVVPEGSSQFITDTGLVSFRMDLFDREMRNWRADMWDSRGPLETSRKWLMRDTSSRPLHPSIPTQRELDLISVLGAIKASQSSRKWLLNSIGYPGRTLERVLPKLIREKKLRLLYHPQLDYTGLTDGLVVAARFGLVRDLDDFIDWVSASAPYARIHYSRKEKSFVALLRLPELRGGIATGPIVEKLEGISTGFLTASLLQRRRYQMTAYHRIHDSTGRSWRDPWDHS